jgi:hypothetical protein
MKRSYSQMSEAVAPLVELLLKKKAERLARDAFSTLMNMNDETLDKLHIMRGLFPIMRSQVLKLLYIYSRNLEGRGPYVSYVFLLERACEERVPKFLRPPAEVLPLDWCSHVRTTGAYCSMEEIPFLLAKYCEGGESPSKKEWEENCQKSGSSLDYRAV